MEIGVFGKNMDPCAVAIKRASEKMGVACRVLDLGEMRKKPFKLGDGLFTLGGEDMSWVFSVPAWYIRQIPLRVPMIRAPATLEGHNCLVRNEPMWASVEESLIKMVSERSLVVNPLETQILQYQKVYQHYLLSKARLPLPEWGVCMPDEMELKEGGEERKSTGGWTGGWVVKGHASGRAVEDLSEYVRRRNNGGSMGPPPLVQRKVAGTPLRVAVVEEEVIGGYAVHTPFTDVREGFVMGQARAERVSIDAETAETAIKALQTLGLFFSEIDFIKTPRETYILEGNPSPGFAFSETLGIPVAERLLAHMVERAKK